MVLDYLIKKAEQLGAERAIQIDPQKNLIFEERVRVSCANNCFHYGEKWTCPPKILNLDYEKAIKEYNSGLLVVVHKTFDDEQEFKLVREKSTNQLHAILLGLEKEAFHQGYSLSTSFIGGSCKLCKKCPPDACNNPGNSRIPMEATGINVIKTMEQYGIILRFPVEDYKELRRIGLLLIG